MKSIANLLMVHPGLLYSKTGMNPCKIHDFLSQNTGITHLNYLFFGGILEKGYSLCINGSSNFVVQGQRVKHL